MRMENGTYIGIKNDVMKILYVTTIGGTMDFFKILIKELIDKGNTVDIATNDSISKVSDFYRNLGCKIFSISASRSPFSLGNFKAIKQIRNIAKDYDIVHCHTPLAGMATRLACRKLRKRQGLKVIYTAHGFHFYKGAPKKNWIIYYPIEKLCSRWTDVLITINKEDYELAKREMKAKRVEYVPGVGIDIQKFSSIVINKDEKRNELGIPKDAYLVLSIGELNQNKNHQIVIKAISTLNNPNIHYAIAGIGDQKDNLEKLAKGLNVNLHLLGYRKDVAELYHIADLFAFPSIREGLGLAAIEAMASSLPLICSDNRGTREYAFDGAIVCKHDDVNAFANGIQKIYLEKHSYEMGLFNHNYVKKFDVNIIIDKVTGIYER